MKLLHKSVRNWLKQNKKSIRRLWRKVRRKPMPYLTRDQLDQFVRTVDEHGGPGSPGGSAHLAKYEYCTSVPVNQDVSPYSEEYCEQQIQVYSEISGRSLSQEDNELTVFDEDKHVAAPNSYNHGHPAGLATHMARLSEAFRRAAAPRGGKMLDMGCGWGLSSEFGATLGFDVTAVDINPAFVSLVNRRAKRLNLPVRGVRSTFDDFTSDDRFDLVLFYECLHHAVRPWSVIHSMRNMLAPGGKIALAGEPINDIWWKNWGMRQDAISVYCIRKFGWFESGWGLDFIRQCLDRAGLETKITHNPDPEIGTTVVAENVALLSHDWLARNATLKGLTLDGIYLVSDGAASIKFGDGYSPGKFTINVRIFRDRPVKFSAAVNGCVVEQGEWAPGDHDLVIPRVEPGQTLTIQSDIWSPHQELNNGDRRRLSFHVNGVKWEPLFTATAAQVPQLAAA